MTRRQKLSAETADAGALLSTLARLKCGVRYDAELDDLHRQALATDTSTRPGGWTLVYLACMFCGRWREVASPEHEARPLVYDLSERLSAYAEGTEELAPLVHGSAELARRHAASPIQPQTLVHGSARPPRRERQRESRPRRRRTRTRSGSRGDPPDDPDEPDDVEPAPGQSTGRFDVDRGAA